MSDGVSSGCGTTRGCLTATVLLATQSHDPATRDGAVAQLASAEQSNPGPLMHSLAAELAQEGRPDEVRRLAGLVLKNTLTAKDATSQAQKAQRWVQAVDPAVRKFVKDAAVQTLMSKVQPARRAAAIVISAVAQIELPLVMWPELIQGLLSLVTQPDEHVKEAALETLGYICEEINPTVLQTQANQILSAVIQGMVEKSETLKYAACVALYNSLSFVRGNFEVAVRRVCACLRTSPLTHGGAQHERDFIMRTVCECCTYAANAKIREAAYECLVRIVELYYEKLQPYMTSLFTMTTTAMKSDQTENVVQQAVEFWSSMCDEEIERIQDYEDGVTEKNACQFFVKAALSWLVPELLQLLTRQDEDADDETWDVAMAAGTCLSLVALTVSDEVVPHVEPFIKQHCTSTDWRFREASMMSFGCIFEGPTGNQVAALVRDGLSVVLTLINDTTLNVKDTATWALGRMMEFQFEHVDKARLTEIFTRLSVALRDDPRVASHACWAIYNIANAYEDSADEPTSALSPFVPALIQQLFTETTKRDDVSENHLLPASYEALNALVQAAAQDCTSVLLQYMPLVVQRLQETFSTQIVSPDDKRELNELQALIVGCIQTVCLRLGQAIMPLADTTMTYLLQLFNYQDNTLIEEVLMAIGSIANAVGPHFRNYMTHLMPLLGKVLQLYSAHRLVNTAVGVVGDITRALEREFCAFADGIVHLLLQLLQVPQLHKSVKPNVMSCFGDIALATSGYFERYLPFVMPLLQQAGTMVLPSVTAEQKEFVNKFREGILDAYTGMVQGLRSESKQAALLPFAQAMLRFCEHCAADVDKNEDVVQATVGLIGDCAVAFGKQFASELKAPWVDKVIRACKKIDGDQARETAQWARNVVSQL